MISRIAVASVFAATAAHSAPLTVVETGAPAVNCLFDKACTLTVSDSTGKFTLPSDSGEGHVQSRRTAAAADGTPAAGLTGYLYRLDMTAMKAAAAKECISLLKIDFGPVATLNYRQDVPAQMFVITSGALGTVGVASAELVGPVLTVTFAGGGVCPGESSYFLGLAAKGAEKSVKAAVKIAPAVPMVLVDAYGPEH